MGRNALHLDDFFKLGRYSMIYLAMLEILMIVQCGSILFMMFGGATPTLLSCKNKTLGPDENLCSLYHQGLCEPKLEYEFYSVNVEFKHLCDDTQNVKDSTSYQMIGYVLGSLFFGQITDVYGRKWPMFVCCLLHGVFGVASAFSTNLWMFSILKTVITFVCTGHIVVSWVYMCETFPKNHRMWMFFAISWSPNIVLVTGIAYLCDDWRTFSLVLNSLAFLASALMLFLHETPHFLVRKGKIADADRVVKRIYEFDGRLLDEAALEACLAVEKRKSEEQSDRFYSYQHLFCTWKFVSWSCTVLFSFFAVSMVNYGILFNLDKLSGSLYFNAAMNGVFRCLLNVISAVADVKITSLGRKKSHAIFAIYTLFSIAAVLVFQQTSLAEQYPFIYQLVLIGTCSMVCQIYAVVGLGALEIFPTPTRNLSFASTMFAEAVATIFAPQLFLLDSFATWLPFAILLVLQAFEMVAYQVAIPESKGKSLADKMPRETKWLKVFRPRDAIADVVSIMETKEKGFERF